MALFLDYNPYPGVNAHLNSAFQVQPGGEWRDFHSRHLNHVDQALQSSLPAGYFSVLEQSLQLQHFDPDDTTWTTADIAISTDRPTKRGERSSALLGAPILYPLRERLSEPEFVGSVVISRVSSDNTLTPVTRIELFSPANKPPGSHAAAYAAKRYETLQSGVCLVEIDYLHIQKPNLLKVASYIDRQRNAEPYNISVHDPRPTIDDGWSATYSVGLLDPLPRITIPLAGKDTLDIDLTPIYRQTVESSTYYTHRLADYSQPPARFETFTPDDQTRIRELMARVAGQAQADA